MKELNEYIYNVFNLIRETQQSGHLCRPKTLSIYWKDKKVLKNIYNVYKLYQYGITKKDFYEICRNYSVNSGYNIIKSGSIMAETLEKSIRK